MLIIIIALILAIGYSLIIEFTTDLNIWFYPLWLVSGILASVVTLLLFAFIFLLINSKTNPKGKFRHSILYHVTGLICIFTGCKLKVEGIENIDPNTNFVIFPNHKSMMDPILIYRASHTVLSAIGKKSLFKFWIIRKVADTFGALPMDRDNDREAAKTLISGVKMVKSGLPYMVFPEGGIKSRETEKMVDLKPGAYKFATKAGADIIPASIIGTSVIKNKGFFKKVNVKIVFHKPIKKEEYDKMNTKELGIMVEDIVNSVITK